MPTARSPFRVLLAAVALTTAAGYAVAQQGTTETQGRGTIDWSKRTVTCTGSGAPNLDAARNAAQARIATERAAKVDAMRVCLEVIKGVRVQSPNVTVGSLARSDGSVLTKVEGAIKNFKVSAVRYFEDGGIEVDIEVSLDGELTRAVVGSQMNRRPPAGDAATGIIIDAKGQALVAVLAPRVLDEAGAEVYGASAVAADGNAGVASYHRTIEAARQDPRVAGAPIVVKALKIQGNTDVVVSAADAAKLRDAGLKYNLFAQGRVAIVKD